MGRYQFGPEELRHEEHKKVLIEVSKDKKAFDAVKKPEQKNFTPDRTK